MEIKKIKISKFKSIDDIEFEIKKYGNSYTTMFLGKNESGKSNILEAMSFLNLDTSEKFDYNEIHNQKDEDNNSVLIEFHLEFESKITYLKAIKEKIKNGDLLNFKIENIIKSLYLEKGSENFYDEIDYKITELNTSLFIGKILKSEIVNGLTRTVESYEISKTQNTEGTFENLTEDLFIKYFGNQITDLIENYIPNCSFWEPSEKYLITDIDLNIFKDNINLNIPLKHIFVLSGYKDKDSIKNEIEKITNHQLRNKLMSTLSKNVTKYVKEIWNHGIEIHIEITDSGKCIVNVKDEGKKNEHNFYRMGVRSEGFKQFMSLILSLSIETKKLGVQNKLILIDEPENHLHPSGVRDLREELLKIGENNYLFISTHSPFLIDINNKERNIIIKKNNSALTEKNRLMILMI